jgi:uncharacterized repeat protein (TIGR01451 family)
MERMKKINIGNKYFVKRIKYNTAVSEIVGELLLLVMITSVMAYFYYNVSSLPPPHDSPNATIIGKLEGNNLILELQKGKSLPLDAAITLDTDIKNTTFLVKDYLDAKAKQDGEWNIGEKVIYPFSYNISTIRNQLRAYLNIADKKTNSLVFIGGFNVYPETDLGISMTVDNMSPSIGSMVNFTICVTNKNGGTPAKDIEILITLSSNFSYFSNITSDGFYNSHTGIWSIPSLERGQSTCLIITAMVTLSSTPTQLAMILDGSGSISSGDWNIMRQGLASSIENSSIFPHDGNVELTVVQFGGTQARVELGPTIVTKSNYLTIGNKIRNLHQLGGYTPMSCGIRLAADQLRNIGNFNVTKRQIINLVTDGVANCYWTSGYSATYQGWDGWIKGDDQHHTGNISAKSSSSRYGDFTCNDVNTIGATSVTVDFWYRLHGTSSSSLRLYFYDGSTYDSIASLGGGSKDTWLHYTKTVTDPQYFKNNFKIRFTTNGAGSVWIDDVKITTNVHMLLNDSFESDYWGENWWNPGLKSAEEASSYLIQKLQMTSDQDEFDALGVGVGGMYGGPDVDWLKDKIVWSQPGHIAPPYLAGWVKTIISWQEFEKTISEIFRGYFGISNLNEVQIISATPMTDPHSDNNDAHLVLTPK